MNILQVLATHIHNEQAVYLLAFILFLSLSLFTINWLSINRGLAAVIRRAEDLLKNVTTIDHATFDKLSEEISKSKLLSHYWGEFEETVIRDDSSDIIKIYNTRPFSDFFDRESLLENKLNLSSFRKVPSVLTSVGLFFTFLFIIFGLMNLHVQKTGKVDGIQLLIEGLSAKFQSSVVAIFFSLIFVVIEDRMVRIVEKQYNRLTDLFDKKFTRKTSEDFLRSIEKNIRDLNHSMKRFATDLAVPIQEGLMAAMRPSQDRLLLAIENLEKQKNENIADTLSSLLEEFKSTLTQGTGNEFSELAGKISKLATVMDQSADRSAQMAASIDSLLKALDGQLQKQERISDSSVEKLEQGFSKLLTSIDSSAKTQNSYLSKMLEDMVSRTREATTGLITNVESLSQRNAGVVDGFSSLNSNLSTSLDKYKETVESSNKLISATDAIAQKVASSISQLAQIQTSMDLTFDTFMKETAVIQTVQKENAESVGRFRSVFKEVETGLDGILVQISKNIEKYNDLTKVGLEGYLNQYDSALNSATTKLSGSVNDLNDVLENLNENIENMKNVSGRAG